MTRWQAQSVATVVALGRALKDPPTNRNLADSIAPSGTGTGTKKSADLSVMPSERSEPRDLWVWMRGRCFRSVVGNGDGDGYGDGAKRYNPPAKETK